MCNFIQVLRIYLYLKSILQTRSFFFDFIILISEEVFDGTEL